ncbi:MAG: hypothetical protein Q4B40_07100 [Clostridia bacterium]|nr:hypothetical protein [Clostridia bacterium]
MKNANSGILKKIENFWYYYKWQTIIIIVVVLSLYTFISSGIEKKEPSDVEILSVYSVFITDKEVDFKSEFLDLLQDADQNGEINIAKKELYITAKGDSENDALDITKFQNSISNSISDLILLDEYNFERFSQKDYYEDLSKYIDVAKFNKENVIYRNEKPVAIRLRKSSFLKNAEFKTDNVYAGIMFVPENADETLLKKRENAAKILLELTK